MSVQDEEQIEEENENDFSIYRATNKTKMPDDSLIEAECTRFKVSRKNFGIIHLSEINRWMGISSAIQFEIFRTEKEVVNMMEKWKKRMSQAVFPDIQKREEGISEEDKCPDISQEFTDFIDAIKLAISDRHPGRLPTISILDPEGGMWVTGWARALSAVQPIFIPTVRFDLDPMRLFYQIPKGVEDFNEPSEDAIFHAHMFASFENLGGVITIPIRPRESEKTHWIIPEGDIPINDISFGDFIVNGISEEELWNDSDEEFCVIAVGSCNSIVLATRVEQLEEILESDFFVQFDH